MNNFNQKIVAITGSTQGIGRALALHILQCGGAVILNSRRTDAFESVRESFAEYAGRVHFVAADVSTDEGAQRFISESVHHFGRVDAVVCNAGMSAYGELEKTQPSVIRQVIDSNLTASALLAHFAIPHLRKTKGSIVFISSLAGFHGLGAYSLYSASKMAYTALGQSLSKEVKDDGIHVGVVYLGFTENDTAKRTLNPDGQLEAVPVRNQIKPARQGDAAALIAGCIADRKSFVTHTLFGRVTHVLSRLFPFIIRLILTNVYRKRKAESISARDR